MTDVSVAPGGVKPTSRAELGGSRGTISAASTTCPCESDSSLVCPEQDRGARRCSPGTSSASPQRLCPSEQPSLSSPLGPRRPICHCHAESCILGCEPHFRSFPHSSPPISGAHMVCRHGGAAAANAVTGTCGQMRGEKEKAKLQARQDKSRC